MPSTVIAVDMSTNAATSAVDVRLSPSPHVRCPVDAFLSIQQISLASSMWPTPGLTRPTDAKRLGDYAKSLRIGLQCSSGGGDVTCSMCFARSVGKLPSQGNRRDHRCHAVAEGCTRSHASPCSGHGCPKQCQTQASNCKVACANACNSCLAVPACAMNGKDVCTMATMTMPPMGDKFLSI